MVQMKGIAYIYLHPEAHSIEAILKVQPTLVKLVQFADLCIQT